MSGIIIIENGSSIIVSNGGILSLGPSGPMTYESLILQDGPIAYWRAGESSGPTLADSSGNGFTATENGAPMRYGEPGLISGASDNDGAVGGNNALADHWNFGQSSILEPTKTVSIECWCKPPNVNEALIQYASGSTLDFSGYKLIYGFNVGTFRFYLGTVDGPNQNTAGNAYLQGNVFPAGSIYHVVGTYTSGSRILYVNGVLDASDTKTGDIKYTPVSGQAPGGLIGNEYNNGSLQGPQPATALEGIVDELAIYDRVLTPTEVLNHYNAGAFGIFP